MKHALRWAHLSFTQTRHQRSTIELPADSVPAPSADRSKSARGDFRQSGTCLWALARLRVTGGVRGGTLRSPPRTSHKACADEPRVLRSLRDLAPQRMARRSAARGRGARSRERRKARSPRGLPLSPVRQTARLHRARRVSTLLAQHRGGSMPGGSVSALDSSTQALWLRRGGDPRACRPRGGSDAPMQEITMNGHVSGHIMRAVAGRIRYSCSMTVS